MGERDNKLNQAKCSPYFRVFLQNEFIIYREFTLENCKKTLLKALQSGVNYIDTAPWYGHGVSEEVLGQVFT